MIVIAPQMQESLNSCKSSLFCDCLFLVLIVTCPISTMSLRFNQDKFRSVISSGSVTEVERFMHNLRMSININDQGVSGQDETPLILATRSNAEGSPKIIKSLLSTVGINLNLADQNGDTALHIAVKSGSIEKVKLLLTCGNDLDLNLLNNNGESPLHLAVRNDAHSYTIFRLLINHGANINTCDNNGWTPLHSIVSMEDTEHSRECFETAMLHGAMLNVATVDGSTPLHLAASHLSWIQLLLQEGAETNILDRNNETPLFCASREGNLSVVAALIDAGANLDLSSSREGSPLHIAIKNGHIDVAHTLLENGASIDIVNAQGQTALHLACMYKELSNIAKELLERGADFQLRDTRGKTALMTAALAGNLQLVEAIEFQYQGYLKTTLEGN